MVQSIHSRVDVTWSIDYVRGTNPVLFSCTTEGDHERLLLKRELSQRFFFLFLAESHSSLISSSLSSHQSPWEFDIFRY
jgi:hypothetical protein